MATTDEEEGEGGEDMPSSLLRLDSLERPGDIERRFEFKELSEERLGSCDAVISLVGPKLGELRKFR